MANERRRGSASRLVLALGLLLVLGVGGALVMVLGVEPGATDGTPEPDSPDRVGDADRSPDAPEASPPPGGRLDHGNASPKVAAGLRGVVRLYRTREPVAGLALTLARADGEPLETLTAGDGTFRFSRLEPAAGYELTGSREPYAAIVMTGIDLEPKEEHDLGTLWLEVAVDLDVEVRDLAGKPVEGAEVAVFATGRTAAAATPQPGSPEGRTNRILALTSDPRPTASATTNADGDAVAAGLLPGRYHVRASAPGHASASRSGVLLAPDAARHPVRLLLSPGHAIEGKVSDEGGEAVTAAEVIAAPGVSREPGLDRIAAQTDEEGRYALRGLAAGRHSLYLAREGLPLLQVGSIGIPDTRRYDIRLRATASIVGTVTGPDGEPVADADVSCQAQGGLPLSARTDEAGEFELLGVPAGQLQWFRVAAEGFVPYPDPSAPQQGVGESLREGVAMRRDVQLEHGIAVAATVLSEADGAPVPGARVQLLLAQMWGGNAAPWTAATDDEGKATISGLLAGDYLVVVAAADYVQQGLASNHSALLQNPQAMPPRWRVSLDPDVEVKEVELRLSRGAVVTGLVLGPDERPVAGAHVTVTGARGELPVFSDAGGAFRVEAVAPSRRATASATAPGFPTGTSEPFVVEPGATVEAIEVKLAGSGRVSGVVRSSDGNPLRGAVVRYVKGHLNERAVWSFRQFDRAEPHPVDAAGRFEISGVAAGEITVRADADGCLPAWDATVEVIENQESGGVDLILSTAVEMVGRVEGPGGSPVAGATVAANYMGTPQRRIWGFVAGLAGQPTAQSDAEGRFTLRGLKPGMYQLWATAQEFRSNTVQTGTGTGEVLLTLAEGLSIAGLVKDDSGAPLGGVPVRATKTGGGGRSPRGFWGGAQVYSAPDGSFEVRNLAEGAYDLTVSGQWIWGREVNVQDTTVGGVSTGRDDVEIIVAAGQTIEGVLLDDEDEPVRVGWISARFEAGAAGPGGASQRWNRVRSDGTFRVVGLQPGTYTLLPYGSFQAEPAKGVSSGAKDVELHVRQGFAIRGWITDADGLSLRGGVSIQCRVAGQEAWKGRNVVMPGDGSFSVLGLEDGAYDLRLTARGHAPLLVANVSTGTDELVLVMADGVSITGLVVDAGGLPVKGANVEARQLRVPQGAVAAATSVRTQESGAFELRGLVEGEYRVIVRAAKHAAAILSPVGGGTADLRVALETGVAVSGTVKDAGGQGLPNARLQLASPDGPMIAYSRSQADGSFEFRNVPSQGSWRLTGSVRLDGRNVAITREEPVESGAADIAVVVQ